MAAEHQNRYQFSSSPCIFCKGSGLFYVGRETRALGILFQPNLYRSSNSAYRFDQCIEPDGQVAGIEHTV
jgi:hypothetical protein